MATIDEVIGRLNRVGPTMTIALHRAMTESLIAIEGDARTMVPHDTRRLAGAMTHRIEGRGLVLVGRVGPNPAVARYGAPVEFGRRAGAQMPPVEALMPWVRRHWYAPLVGSQMVIPGMERHVRATNARSAGPRVTESGIRRRAWILARAIARRGIVRHPYLQPAYAKNRALIYSNFVKVGAQVAVSLTGGPRP